MLGFWRIWEKFKSIQKMEEVRLVFAKPWLLVDIMNSASWQLNSMVFPSRLEGGNRHCWFEINPNEQGHGLNDLFQNLERMIYDARPEDTAVSILGQGLQIHIGGRISGETRKRWIEVDNPI
jgi:hypothetical protein